MADAKHVDELVDQVLSALDVASPEVVFILTKKLAQRVVHEHDYQQAAIVDNEFECPHCFKSMDDDQMTLIDLDWRENDVYDVEFNEEDDDSGRDYSAGGTLKFDNDLNQDHDDIAFVCRYCKLPFQLPDGWEKDWV